MDTMKAAAIRSYGGPKVLHLEDLPVPEIMGDEILIKVQAVGVNPLDWKVRAGFLEGMVDYKFPLIPGWDVSGTVKQTGADVQVFKPGDAVYALADITRNGACAQYMAVKAGQAALKPVSVSHVQAASIPMTALTAWQALFGPAELESGQRILIHAAAGGIGTMAVQLAKFKGAYVIGTASGQNRDFLAGLGADEVVDYTVQPFDEVVKDVHVVLDTMGGEVQERSWNTLAAGGILVSLLGPPDTGKASRDDLRSAAVLVQPDAEQLTEIAGLIDKGSLKPVVSHVLPLEEIAKAHEMSETHHVRGKIVLEVSEPGTANGDQ